MAQLWALKSGGTAINPLTIFVILALSLQTFSCASVGWGSGIHFLPNSIGNTRGPGIKRQSGEVTQPKDTLTGLNKRIKDLEKEVKRLRSIKEALSTSAAPTYKLRFVEPLAERVYLGHPIQSKGNKAVGVELVDPTMGYQRVTNGVLSSLPVMMVPLQRGFDESVKWDAHYFSRRILSSAENRIPLLQGDTKAVLCRGYAEIPGAMFSTNRELIDKYVRIGVQVDPNHQVGPTILEAVSDEVRLLCNRSKANQKPDTPLPDDPVWRIRGIGKNGPFHRSLHDRKIDTVKDFLRMLITQPTLLREIANRSGERGKVRESDWSKITEHAEKCSPDPDEFYLYHLDSSGSGLLFNSFYQFVEALVEGCHILSQDQLDPFQKEWIDQLQLQAYRNLNNLVPIRRWEWPSAVFKLPTFGDSPLISASPQMNQDALVPVQDPMDAYPFQGLPQVDEGQTDGLMSTMDSTGFVPQPEIPASLVGTNEPSEQIFSTLGYPRSPGTFAETGMLCEHVSEFGPSY